MSLDMTTFAAALKTLYSPDKIENMVYKDNPFFALVPKAENFYGDSQKIPIVIGNPQGRSATFSNAQANKTNSQLKAFYITRDHDYSLATIDNETLEASENDKGAFLSAATVEIDGAIQSCTRSLAIALYGTGSGSIGQCNANASSTSLQLKDIEDVTNFELGMELVVSTANGGGSVKSGSVTVVGVNRDSGELTVDALTAIDGGSGVAANDYIFVEGDYDGKIKGLRAWLPDSAPTSASFFGVDRTADVSRLAGIRYDGSSEPIEEALISAASRVAREGGKPDYCFMSYSKFADLEKALGSKVQYVDAKVNAEIGFRGIMISGPRGSIKVIPDQNCPSDRAFMISMSSWKLHSLKKAPRLLDSDGLRFLRESSSDGVEVRVGYYAQLASRSPGYNANIKLD